MTTHHVLLHVEEQSNDKVYNLPIHRWLDILWYNHCKGFVGCNVQNKRSFAEKKHLKKKRTLPRTNNSQDQQLIAMNKQGMLKDNHICIFKIGLFSALGNIRNLPSPSDFFDKKELTQHHLETILEQVQACLFLGNFTSLGKLFQPCIRTRWELGGFLNKPSRN